MARFPPAPRLRRAGARQTERSGGAGRKGGWGERNSRPALAFRRRRISYFALRNAPLPLKKF